MQFNEVVTVRYIRVKERKFELFSLASNYSELLLCFTLMVLFLSLQNRNFFCNVSKSMFKRFALASSTVFTPGFNVDKMFENFENFHYHTEKQML